MALSNGTKQYILNYDSKYLYPYTLLQCIIDEDNPALTGETAIISKIAKYVQDSTEKTTGAVLGINNTDSDALSLQRLDNFSNAAAYKYKYFSGNAEFIDLPKITFTGLDRTFNVTSDTGYNIVINNDYFDYNTTGLCVNKSKGLVVTVDIIGNPARHVYFDNDGKPVAYNTNIGSNSNFIYYDAANAGFTASTLNTTENVAVYFKAGTVVEVPSANLVAGKLLTNNSITSQAFPAVPYILPTDDTVKYTLPKDNTNLTVLAYKPDGAGSGELTWTNTVGFLSMEIKKPTENDSKYFILGVDETALDQSGANTLYSAANSDVSKSIYFKNFSLYNASDERLKTFTGGIDIDFDKLSEIKKGIFYWNSDETKTEQLGVTAQSVKDVFPQIVSENDGMYSVAYDRFGVIALAAIDRLHKENEELLARVKALEAKIK